MGKESDDKTKKEKEVKGKSIIEKLQEVQAKLKAPKSQFNKFGNYKYRNLEDIQEAVKPLLAKIGAIITLSDEMVIVGERYYVKVTASFICGKDTMSITAFARESENKKGMDDSQITGAASSYARKYAMNGLLAIDDTKDADGDEGEDRKPKKTGSKPETKSPEEKKPPVKPAPGGAKIKDVKVEIDEHLKYLDYGIVENRKIMAGHKEWTIKEWVDKAAKLRAEVVTKMDFEGTAPEGSDAGESPFNKDD